MCASSCPTTSISTTGCSWLVDVLPSLAGDGAQLMFCYDSAILSDGRIREMAQRLERAIALLASSEIGIAGTVGALRSDIDL